MNHASEAQHDERGRPVLEPGADHPITVEPSGTVVTVRLGRVIVAQTWDALVLREAGYPPVLYVPVGDVDADLLAPSDHTTYCPYKGDATYWTLRTDEHLATDAVWGYPDPRPAVGAIAGHVAFYPGDVDVLSDPPVDP